VSDLARRQRVLLKSLKGRPLDRADAGEEARLQRAAACTAMLRETMLWWRQLGISNACPLTVAVLKRAGRWPAILVSFVRDTPGSTYIGIQAEHFLDYLANDGDALTAAVARTERALRSSAADSRYRAEVAWPCDPAPVLNHCLNGTPLDADAGMQAFNVRIGWSDACSLQWLESDPMDNRATTA